MSDGPNTTAPGTNYVVEKLQQDRALIEVSISSARSDIEGYQRFIEKRQAQIEAMEGNLLAIDTAIRSLLAE